MRNTQLNQLLTLRVPFAVVYANSAFGHSRIFVMLENDYELDKTVTGFSPAYSQKKLVEKELEPADFRAFERLKEDGQFAEIDLGADGTAYELKARPFRDYYKEATKKKAVAVAA